MDSYESRLIELASLGLGKQLPGLEFEASRIFWGQRYGGKAAVKLKHNGKEYAAILLFMNPGASTGSVIGKKFNKVLPIYHADTALEWACPLAFEDGEVSGEEASDGEVSEARVTHMILLNDLQTESSQELRSYERNGLFSTLKRRVQYIEDLMSSASYPTGYTYVVGDPHALINSAQKTLAVLIRSVKLSNPLELIDEMFIEKTGGTEAYLSV